MKQEMKIAAKKKIYVEFYTNSAVAWFSFGVITPVTSGFKSLNDFIFSAAAILASYIFLKFAEAIVDKQNDS